MDVMAMVTALAGLADDLVKKLVPTWDQSHLDKIYSLTRDLQNAESSGNPPDMNYLDEKREELQTYVKTFSDAIRSATNKP